MTHNAPSYFEFNAGRQDSSKDLIEWGEDIVVTEQPLTAALLDSYFPEYTTEFTRHNRRT